MAWGKMQLRWKVAVVAALIFLPAMAAGTVYFSYRVYQLQAQTALAGLMNFADAKQQGVVRFIGQNVKLAKQLAAVVLHAEPAVTRRYFRSVTETDVFDPRQHPFYKDIQSGARKVPTWRVYHTIDYVRQGKIEISSHPEREGQDWAKELNVERGYSDVWLDNNVPVLSFAAPVAGGMIYVHADARMLSLIVSGEIGNMEGGMAKYYLAGVGKTFDYYIVDSKNVMITESRVLPDAFLKAQGSEFPWKVTQKKAGISCDLDDTYVTNAGLRTFCQEAMGHYIGKTGKKTLGASMPFYDSGWTVVVEQDEAELLQPLIRLVLFMTALGGGIGLAAFMVFVFLIGRFVLPRMPSAAGSAR